MFTVIQAHSVTHDIWHLPPVSLSSKILCSEELVRSCLCNVATLGFTSVTRQQSILYVGGTGFCLSWLIFFMDFLHVPRHMLE